MHVSALYLLCRGWKVLAFLLSKMKTPVHTVLFILSNDVFFQRAHTRYTKSCPYCLPFCSRPAVHRHFQQRKHTVPTAGQHRIFIHKWWRSDFQKEKNKTKQKKTVGCIVLIMNAYWKLSTMNQMSFTIKQRQLHFVGCLSSFSFLNTPVSVHKPDKRLIFSLLW